LLTLVDTAVLAAYCSSYGRWVEAERKIAAIRAANPDAALVVKGQAGSPVPNPLIRIARLAAADMAQFAVQFGLTPRTRVSAGVANGPGKFDGLLAE
jgi:P27 family predicted phage terminase small subunit